jgi:hypothetical protein
MHLDQPQQPSVKIKLASDKLRAGLYTPLPTTGHFIETDLLTFIASLLKGQD